MHREQLVTGEIYHIYNRGVEKRSIFLDDNDRFRFIHDLFEFNDEAPASNMGFYFKAFTGAKRDKLVEKPRRNFVDIICFCFMPDHYHLLLRQKTDGGITEFMRKLGTGYTNYFNQKYQRVGPLFQGRFKSIHITKQPHLIYLPHYIHLNPLDLYMPTWREKRIRNYRGAFKYLESYRWSSYLDSVGKRNFPSIFSGKLFAELIGSPTSYKKAMMEWLRDMDLYSIRNVSLEDLWNIGSRTSYILRDGAYGKHS